MKYIVEKSFILTFNIVESTYKEEERLAAPGQGRGWGSFGSSSGPRYKYVRENISLEEIEFFGKKFLISDDLDEIKWEMTSEQKKIGDYTCFKAIAKKKAPFNWSEAFAPPRPRGNRASGNRARGDRDINSTNIKDSTNIKLDPVMVEIPKTIDIVAWYTPQIPVSHGPGEFGGLPGLILELTTDQTVLLCSKIVINPEKKDNILMPSKGEKLSLIHI